jgi:hypothetical protein
MGIAIGNNQFTTVGQIKIGSNNVQRVYRGNDLIFPTGLIWNEVNILPLVFWRALTFGNDIFVAISSPSNQTIMISSDGINWQTNTFNLQAVFCVAFGNGIFVAPTFSGLLNSYMTSTDGLNWTMRTHSTTIGNGWRDIVYNNNLFVCVGANSIMTSNNGIDWTSRTSPQSNVWESVIYGNGIFVAVSSDGTNRVMTSSDGINWILRTSSEQNNWLSVTYGNNLFVAVSSSGTNRVMTSSDGITWTSRTSPLEPWQKITFGNGIFVAISESPSQKYMISFDGINWNNIGDTLGTNNWAKISYGNNKFVSLAISGSSNQPKIMTANY